MNEHKPGAIQIASQTSLTHTQGHIVQVGDRLYQISEISQPHPVPISPSPIESPRHSTFDDAKSVIAWGVCVVLGTAGLSAFIGAMLTRPTPPPAPVVVQPPPPPQPYYVRTCRASGLLGLNQDCIEERGTR